MLRQLVDALREHRDLHLGRARIRLVAAVLLDQVLLGFLGESHPASSFESPEPPLVAPRKKRGGPKLGRGQGSGLRMNTRFASAGVAAGHPATAAAGVEILADGGGAADAAVAAGLASCVAETVMTGLLGGGHAVYYDAASGTARNLDCFCAVPGLGTPQRHRPELVHLQVPFGAELVHYAVGPASCAVPGVPAGLEALSREHGRLSWPRLVQPAVRFAARGVAFPPPHAARLAVLAPGLTMNEGARLHAPPGELL